jgi:hypothetical protein
MAIGPIPVWLFEVDGEQVQGELVFLYLDFALCRERVT